MSHYFLWGSHNKELMCLLMPRTGRTLPGKVKNGSAHGYGRDAGKGIHAPKSSNKNSAKNCRNGK